MANNKQDKEKEGRRQGRALPSLAAFILLTAAGTGMGLMNMYFGTGHYKIPLLEFLLSDSRLIALNAAPFALLILALWCLFAKAWIAFLLSGAFCLFVSWGQYWKLMARSDPIYAEDIVLFKDAVSISDGYLTVTWQIILSAVLVFVGTVFFISVFHGRKEYPRFRFRALLLALILAAGGASYAVFYRSDALYDSFPVWEELNPWFENSRYMSRGAMYPFLHSVKSAVVKPPEGYSASEAEKLLASFPDSEIPEDKKISVISVMLEAYSDLSLYTDMITGEDPYAAYHELAFESYTGRLLVNVFGGGTINTERSALTGFPEPGNFRSASWSYARYFGDNGYALQGSHSGYADFYNRRNVNRNLGIDGYLFLDDHYSEFTSWPSGDKILLPEIVRLASEEFEQGRHVFSFNVTYQNHGPYSDTEKYFDAEYVPLEGMDEGSYVIINNYLDGIRDTSENMLAMARSLEDIDEPVVLLFFGDHKPWLGDQSQVYEALGVSFAEEGERSFYNYYGTEYLLWANRAARRIAGDISGKGPDISPCYLADVLFQRCGWAGPSFLKLSRRAMAVLPVVSSNDRFLDEGKLVSESELSLLARGELSKLRIAAYYLEYEYMRTREE